MDTPAPDSPAPGSPSDAPPAALADLIAAGLVSHEMIGDPAQLGSEAATLTALCGLIGGPIYRVDPFHYAFRAGPEDHGGRLGQLAPGDWTEALAVALRAALGEDAVWLSATDLPPGKAAPLDQPLLFLRAHAAAATEALAAAPPGSQAVISARYAAEVARLTARSIPPRLSEPQVIGAEAGTTLARRLAVIELRQEAILERLTEQSRPTGPDPLAQTLAPLFRRLDAQAAALDALAGQLAALTGGGVPAFQETFQETLGLTLAEFLARLERQAQDVAPVRVPQFN